METSESLTVGLGGWAEWHSPDFSGRVRLRFSVLPNGRIGIVESNFLVTDVAHSNALRAIPIGRIEALANTPIASATLRARIGVQEDTGALLDLWDQLWARVVPPPESCVIDADGPEQTQMDLQSWNPEHLPSLIADFFTHEPVAAITLDFGTRSTSFRLEVPADPRKPDSFYKKVAEVYGFAATESANPSHRIAEVNRIPVAKIYQWVKEARRRGFLPPATRSGRPMPPSAPTSSLLHNTPRAD